MTTIFYYSIQKKQKIRKKKEKRKKEKGKEKKSSMGIKPGLGSGTRLFTKILDIYFFNISSLYAIRFFDLLFSFFSSKIKAIMKQKNKTNNSRIYLLCWSDCITTFGTTRQLLPDQKDEHEQQKHSCSPATTLSVRKTRPKAGSATISLLK